MALFNLKKFFDPVVDYLVFFSNGAFSAIPSDFDPKFYFGLNPDIARIGVNPFLHYVRHGKKEQREYKAPPDFPIDFDPTAYLELNPDVAYCGTSPYLHFIQTGRREHRPYKHTGLTRTNETQLGIPEGFDPETYRNLHPDLATFQGSLEQHYLRFGLPELRRFANGKPPQIPKTQRYSQLPPDFDPDLYTALNPDIVGYPVNAYDHYIDYGIAHRRSYQPIKLQTKIIRPLESEKTTLAVISPSIDQTDDLSVIQAVCRLAKDQFNIVVIQLETEKGESFPKLENNITISADIRFKQDGEMNYLFNEIHQLYAPFISLLAGIHNHKISKRLTLAKTPSLMFVSDLIQTKKSKYSLHEAKIWTTSLVFTNPFSRIDAIDHLPESTFKADLTLGFHKGQFLDFAESIPAKTIENTQNSALEEETLKTGYEVVGFGEINFNGGIDLFIDAAIELSQNPSIPTIHFTWFSPDTNTLIESDYGHFVREKIRLAGSDLRISIAAASDGMNQCIAQADLMLLTSRRDPLALRGLQALAAGVPVICFEGSSPLANLLIERGLKTSCTAPYMDVQQLVSLAEQALAQRCDPGQADALNRVTARLLSGDSDFGSVVEICKETAEVFRSLEKQVGRLSTEGSPFDPVYYTGEDKPFNQQVDLRVELCWSYVLSFRAQLLLRKPRPGFNPFIHRDQTGTAIDEDPLLHSLSPTSCDTSSSAELVLPSQSDLVSFSQLVPVALHIHAYYTDLLPDILERVRRNKSDIHVYVTVNTQEKFDIAKSALGNYGYDPDRVSICGNIGRDVFPFLELADSLVDRYQIIGHVHTKKSPHMGGESETAIRWRELLLGNLLGGEHAHQMADRVVGHLTRHQEIKIVFPDDPQIVGWGVNESAAIAMLGESAFNSLPKHFDFPVGTMFWAKSSYIKDSLQLNLPSRFSPAEPLPTDGTILHAWERFLGAAAAGNPPLYALTYVPGLLR